MLRYRTFPRSYEIARFRGARRQQAGRRWIFWDGPNRYGRELAQFSDSALQKVPTENILSGECGSEHKSTTASRILAPERILVCLTVFRQAHYCSYMHV